MSATLRVDDFPGVKPEEFWKHNLENFKKFDVMIEKHGIEHYILGVVPKYVTLEMIKWLAENPRIEVALHGIEHDNRFDNEFREWETEDDVYKKIVAAREPLKECNGYGDVRVYIPPKNIIDMKTLRALSRAGFERVLVGPGADLRSLQGKLPVSVNYSAHPIQYGRTDEMLDRDHADEKLLSETPHSLKDTVVTLHWTWENNIGLQHLDRFLSRVSVIFK